MRWIVALVLVVISAGAHADIVKPRIEQEPLPRLPMLPDLAGLSTYGEISQAGRSIALEGPSWTALGEIRADGKLQLVWTEVRTGRVGLSVYDLDSTGHWKGHWGWLGEVRIEGDMGEVTGAIMLDIMRVRIPVPTPEPPIF